MVDGYLRLTGRKSYIILSISRIIQMHLAWQVNILILLSKFLARFILSCNGKLASLRAHADKVPLA